MARGVSIAALIFSIVFPIVGLVLGIVALRQERSAGENGTMAIVAIVLSAIGTFLLVFVVLIAGIAAFGVFSPDRFVQERCVGNAAGFVCSSGAVGTDFVNDAVMVSIAYAGDEPVRVTAVSVGDDCREVGSVRLGGEPLPVVLAPNDDEVLRVECAIGSVRANGVFQDTFEIHYDVVGGLSDLTSDIEVASKT